LHLADALFAAPILTIPQAQRLLAVTYPSFWCETQQQANFTLRAS
jgi:hypothetical protein